MTTAAIQRVAASSSRRPGPDCRGAVWRLDVCGRIEAALERHELLVLQAHEAGTVITCLGGTLWITVAGDPRDYILGMHERLRLATPRAVVIVHALAGSRLAIADTHFEPLTIGDIA